MSSPYGPPGYGRTGDGWYAGEPQPWDPAYPHPTAVQHSTPGYGAYPPPPQPVRTRHSRGLIGAVVVLSLALVASLVLLATGVTRTTNGTAIAGNSTNTNPSSGGSGNTNPVVPGNGSGSSGSSGGSSGTSSGKATSAQQIGVVDIYTEQKFNMAEAAGTGMVLTSNGDVVTNNHVIQGSTSIKVRIVSTGKVYSAKVVGTAPTKDIAVIHLANASGLTTANFGDSDTVSVGDAVVGVGNAGGTGGTPSAASGKITELHKTITASDESNTNSETLHDVMVTDAPIQSGDSGGPLYNSDGRVVGIDTAASKRGAATGFAIPINNALTIAKQIQKGIETSSIHIGYPAFLGVSMAQTTTGAVVQQVLAGTPAESAGISAGDTITRVDNTSIATSKQLHDKVSSYQPGAKVSVTYNDPTTGRHTVTLTLMTGPAD